MVWPLHSLAACLAKSGCNGAYEPGEPDKEPNQSIGWPFRPVAGRQYEHQHDDLGNRMTSATGGDATGSGMLSSAYTVNNFNQYTQGADSGMVDGLGAAVTVNSDATLMK